MKIENILKILTRDFASGPVDFPVTGPNEPVATKTALIIWIDKYIEIAGNRP